MPAPLTTRTLLLAALCAGAGGCALGPKSAEGLPSVTMAPAEQTVFASAPDILDESDVAQKRGGWATGDQALVGIILVNGAHRSVRYVLIELTPVQGPLTTLEMGRLHAGPPFMSTRGVQLILLDARGRELSRSIAWVPEPLLDHGPFDLLDFMAWAEGQRITLGAEDLPDLWFETAWQTDPGQAALLGLATMTSLGRGAGQNPAIASVVEDVLTLAQKFGVLTQGMSFRIDEKRIEPTGVGTRPAYRVPVQLRIGPHIALRALMQADRPDAPLGLTGGIVAVDGYNTTDPSRSIHIRVLATRRGPDTSP